LENDDGKWKYVENVDKNTNGHGRTFFKDLCVVGNVKPINGLKFSQKTFKNDFTFLRSNGRSQIDFCLTNQIGRRKVKDFDILSNDWHISDHRPIKLQLEIECGIDIGGLIKRANDLNCTNNDSITEIQQFKGKYDVNKIEQELIRRKAELESSIERMVENADIQGAIDSFDEHIKEVHKRNKIKRTEEIVNT
jgi:hypothetical protein